jgi:hypothetical protein
VANRLNHPKENSMNLRITSIAAASLLVFAATAQAQQAPDASKPNPSAATSTGTSTTQSEMNRGVPGVNVDVGRNAPNGVVGADVDRNTDSRNLTDRNRTDRNLSDRNLSDRSDTSGSRSGFNERAPRADRN